MINKDFLNSVMTKNDDTLKALAEAIGVTDRTLKNKCEGRSAFIVREALLIKERYLLTMKEFNTLFNLDGGEKNNV